MDQGLVIREMTREDVPAARALMLRVVEEDFEDPHSPVIHADIDDLEGWYIRSDGPFMMVVEDTATGEIVATGGIRGGALKEGLSPAHLVERYRDGRTGQLVRIYVLRQHRRRHIARELVAAVLERAKAEGHYTTVGLHTYPHSPGALPFWLSMGCELVADDTDGISRAMFFEFVDPPATESRKAAGEARTACGCSCSKAGAVG